MRSDDDHRVLFLIEENRFDAAWNLADLRAVLEIVGEAHCS